MATAGSDIQKYLQLIVKKRFLFIAISLLVMSGVVWGSYFISKRYMAKCTVFIESNVIERLVKGVAITPSMTDRLRVIKDTMLSRALVLKVLEKLDMASQAKDEAELEEMIADYQERTRIRLKERDLFTVAVLDKSPRVARDYVNVLVRTYVEQNISAKREEAYGANRFLNDQVAHFKEKLDRVEDKIIKFRQEQGIYMSMDETSLIDEIKARKNEVEQLETRKNELLAIKKSIGQQIKGETPEMVVLSSRGAFGNTEKLVKSLEDRLSQLLITYNENYPEIIKLKAEIEAIKNSGAVRGPEGPGAGGETEMTTINPIYQELREKLIMTEAELDAISAKMKHLKGLIQKKEQELRYIPEGKKQLADLEKERASYKNIYEQLLMRHGQSEVSKQMEIEDKATTFRIVDPAVLPLRHASPNRAKIIILGVFLGLMGGFGGVLMAESLDDSIKSSQALKSLGVEVLAVIPRIPIQDEDKRKKRKEALLYAATAMYLLVIGLAFVHEMLGLTYIDRVLSSAGLYEIAENVKELI